MTIFKIFASFHQPPVLICSSCTMYILTRRKVRGTSGILSERTNSRLSKNRVGAVKCIRLLNHKGCARQSGNRRLGKRLFKL
jgi:hypothetical protein